MRTSRAAALGLAAAALGVAGLSCPPFSGPPGNDVLVPVLGAPVRVVTDRWGVRHIFAEDDLDLARAQGYVHARDRFWQMDVTRREVSGTLAELLGSTAIAGDIRARTFGLRRAAERSEANLGDREREVLQAYADGVNAYLELGTLPPEYALLELTEAAPWTVTDTLAIGKAISAQLSLDIDTGLVEQLDSFVRAGQNASPPYDGAKLFFEDVRRFAPMDPAATVPDATGTQPFLAAAAQPLDRTLVARAAGLARQQTWKPEESPLLARIVNREELTIGSNEWGVTAAASANGRPMIANDPHLSLDAPSTFYENHLVVANDPLAGPMNSSGMTFPGVPFVILGQNERITWGATTNPMDVADVFRDRIVRRHPSCPVQFCIVSAGAYHPVQLDFASYFANEPGDGIPDNVEEFIPPIDQRLIITVPFRSFGPVIGVENAGIFTGGTVFETHVLVLQYTGFHATEEVQAFRIWNRARNLDEFLEGLRHFDVGSQNWAYADSEGNLGYFSSAELPLRADLEAGAVAGLPPYFVREGESGQNNWVPDPARSQGQAIPYAILPFEEMPQALNPPAGFFENANNDPAGVTLDNDPMNQRRTSNPNAIYYLKQRYGNGLRAGRIQRLLHSIVDSGRKVSISDMRRIQGNTQELDAELLTPFLLQAFESARRAGAPAELAAFLADARVAEAIARLAAWDYSTPTGIAEGWDASDPSGVRLPQPPAREVAHSIAATIFNVWRAKAIGLVIDATLSRVGAPSIGAGDALVGLHHLLAQAPFTGVGASGADFFVTPAGLSAEDQRDVTLLAALRSALDSLASNSYAAAFSNSTNQDDYRWGRLHRKTFSHRLPSSLGIAPSFSIPPAAGFVDLAPGLAGLSRDGGFEVVNASGYGAKSDGSNAFRFGGGPVRRYVGSAGAGAFEEARVVGFNVYPGGPSGDPTSPLYASQLALWLTADQHSVPMSEAEAQRGALGTEVLRPGE